MSGHKLDLQTLIQRATAGLDLTSSKMFKPSMTYRVLEDPYLLWCDYHAPKSEAVDETSRFEDLRMKWGGEYETRWVREHYPNAVEIKPRWGREALEATMKAMLEGVPAIHAPQLWSLGDECYGVGDVIVRSEEAASDLGKFHYRVKEIKRSKSLKDYQAVQAVIYNRVLNRLQGFRPPTVDVVLQEETATVAAKDYEALCDDVLARWKDVRDNKVKPEPPAFDEAGSPWRIYTNRLLQERRDVTLFPGFSASARKKLEKKLGVSKLEELEKLGQEDFQKAFGPKSGVHIWLKYRAHVTRMPVFNGERVEIPRRKRRFYFDFETSEGTHPTIPPHVYMIGSYDAERHRFDVFIARGAGDEERIFRDFLDKVGDPADACLYHWTGFEIGQMEGVAERHPALKDRLSRLIDACVDLKECIAKKVFFGTRTYSIKQVAPFLGFNWRQGKQVDAFESMVLYWEWLEDQDPAKIQKVIQYNEDDCMAMLHIDRALATSVNGKA